MEIEQQLIIEEIFTDEKEIIEMWENPEPINFTYDIIESYIQQKTGRLDNDPSMILALAEFHVNNLIFIKENFSTFPNHIIIKLLNLLNVLLNFSEESIGNLRNEEDNIEDGSKELDFMLVCQKKIKEIKQGLICLNLINVKPNSGGDKNFYMKNNEIVSLLDYIKRSYFPFIRLYYNFMNYEKITENKKIEVIINRPLAAPALNLATMHQEKQTNEENKETKSTGDPKNVNFEENQKKEAELTKEEAKKEEKLETYQDLMNKLNLNFETKKIIAEKIEEMHKDINHKVTDRQKKLEDKLKEVEDVIKGKKK